MAVLECTAYHGAGVDRKGDIRKVATTIKDISIIFSTGQLKVFRQRHRLFEVTLIEDHGSIPIDTESNAFRRFINTIRFCDLPSTSAQNKSCFGKWLSLGKAIQTILKFAVLKDCFARVGKLAEVIAGDKFAVFEFDVTIVLAEKKEVSGRLLPNENTMDE